MRVRQKSLIRTFSVVMAVLGVAAGLVARPQQAHAGAYTYGTRQRTINAGVLVVDDVSTQNQGNIDNYGLTTATAADPTPYLFYILNQREDLKPFGWNIINPLAPRTVTGDIIDRWNYRTSNGAGYALNQPVTPNMAAYWEVRLTKINLTDLEQFNVLLLPVRNHTMVLTDTEINLLRRYVDNGGQLWIEDAGNGAINGAYPTGLVNPNASGLFFNMVFNNTAAQGALVLPNAQGLLLHHPIIAAPYLLTPSELNSLGTAGISGSTVTPTIVSAGTTNVLPDTGVVSTVLGNYADQDGSKNPMPVIAAGQYGAGQVVVDSIGSAASVNDAIAGVPDGFGDPNAGPYCGTNFSNAPDVDLKFAYNVLAWSSAHLQEYKTSHQSSDSANTLGPALTPSWTYPITPGNNSPSILPGAAINGNFVYVRDATGTLDAFNATPGTDIIGTGNPDAGFPDYVNGSPWDEVWDSATKIFPPSGSVLGQTFVNGSAPTVATIPTGQTLVFVENAAGKVFAADATTGIPYASGAFSQSGGSGGTTYGASDPAPAPTYYGGRLFAGQPDGTLYVCDLRTGAQAIYTVDTTQQPVIASPTVGLVEETVRNQGVGYADDLVVTVTTPDGTFTLHGGARHDLLNAENGNYVPLPANSNPLPFDIEGAGTNPEAYNDVGGYQNLLSNSTTATGFNITGTPILPVMGDYDTDFNTASSTTSSPLLRAQFGVGGITGTLARGGISAPALGPNGCFYYTVNTTGAGGAIDSTLVCAHDGRSTEAPPPGRSAANQIQWRFRLPYIGEAASVDADGVNYALLAGYHFVGTPVLDTQGHVFALATNNTTTAVLCFDINTPVTLSLYPVTSANGRVTVSQLTQPITTSTSATGDEFGNPTAPAVTPPQYNGFVNNLGLMGLQNFGLDSPLPQGGFLVTPNLSEPQPVQATYTVAGTGGGNTQTVTALMHTNLVWYTFVPALTTPGAPTNSVVTTSSPALIGNYLFWGDNNGYLWRLYAYPQTQGLVSAERTVAVSQQQTVNNVVETLPITGNDGNPLINYVQANVGAITGPISASNSVLIANGLRGVAAFGSQFTLVSDASRVMEVDSEGAVTWAVDSTAEADPTTGRVTHVALSHPASVTQITSNDYLVADTGNNRCVRFDRAGNVIWELTRFNDAPLGTAVPFYTNTTGQAYKKAPLLAPGESLTLNHPTSVTSYVQVVHDPNNPATVLGTIVHYLIADTGNDRIVEVVDAFGADGKPVGVPHDLVWVSRTYDALGRRYAYTDANYFVGPTGYTYIAALVSNKRVAGPIPKPGQMLSVSADAPGSSLVLLDYDPTNTVTTQANGFISHTISQFLGYFNSNGTFNITGSPKLIPASNGTATIQPATATPTVVQLRNPRFLQTYTPPSNSGTAFPIQNFLLADDNGVYDLTMDQTGADSGGGATYAGYLEALWGFTQNDYQLLPGRLGIPFVPNSLQRTNSDPVALNGTTYLMGHYLVTNGYSTGEVTPISGFGGEVLELAAAPNLITTLVNSYGKFSGSNAAPLSQPTYAAREK